jgi:hypothetical protein
MTTPTSTGLAPETSVVTNSGAVPERLTTRDGDGLADHGERFGDVRVAERPGTDGGGRV